MQTTPILHEEDVAYRQVSPTAVVALLLGIASLVAFVGPAFFLVPAAAIGAALLALSKISRSEGVLTGANLARAAMALAVACMAAALVRGSVRDALMERQAVETTQQWLDLLAKGRIKDARQLLSTDGASSLLPSPQMGQPAPSREDAEAIILDALRNDRLTEALVQADGAWGIDEPGPPVFDGGRAIIGLSFTMGDGTKDGHRHGSLQLSRIARYVAEGRPWRVDRWNVESPHAAH